MIATIGLTLLLADPAVISMPWPTVLQPVDGDVVPAEAAAPFLVVAVVDEASGKLGSPIIGAYRRQQDRLVFIPAFKLLSNVSYRIHRTDPTGVTTTEDLRLAAPPSAPPTVVAVYPTTSTAPANLLKFYIHFSQPMREGREIFQKILLLDDQGNEVIAPWRPTELWNADSTRLTLWIHPGRIKQGLSLREVEGPVLEEGRRYTLVITPAVVNPAGTPLALEHRKSFAVGPEDHESPTVDRWQIEAPTVGAQQPVCVRFPEPLDRHLAARCLEVTNAIGRPIAGSVKVSDQERCWVFTPAQAWRAGEHRIAVDPVLEDLAGNSPVKPFEVDGADSKLPPLPTVLSFSPLPKQ